MADRRLPVKNSDLHGSAPDEARAALLLIDVINDLEFEGGAGLLVHALPMAARLAAFKQRAKAAGLPAIYVNDNFGRWQSDLAKLVEHCLGPEICGRPGRATPTRGRRLFRPQTQAFRVLLHRPRDIARLPARRDPSS